LSLLTFTKKGIYCAQGDFYIDPWLPVDKAIITHAHADHARSGMKHYLCHHYTKPLLHARISADISVQSAGYSEPIDIQGVRVSLHPAGHIIGSAQIRIEYKGFISVISGDYKTIDDGISTPIEIVRCNEFVSESTFGLPIYKWESNDRLQSQMQSWIKQNQSAGKTSIFVAYSLGKAQRIMKMVEGMGPLYVHNSIARLNEAIMQSGIQLPHYEVLHEVIDKKEIQGSMVIVPPALLGTSVLKKIPNGATAICSGWMQVRGHRRWRAVDAGFAISDHADWDGLLEVIKESQAEKVFVTHGKTASFSKYLNELGIDAEEVPTKFGDEEEDTLTAKTPDDEAV
jgi:putative mRNA 3-end processing factor